MDELTQPRIAVSNQARWPSGLIVGSSEATAVPGWGRPGPETV